MIEGHVLVLNKSWVAVHVTRAHRAITMLYLDMARAVHPNDYSLHSFDEWLTVSSNGLAGRYVHTPLLRIRVPEVVLLNHFNGFVRHPTRFSRHAIIERDHHMCQYCGAYLTKSQLTIDHVIPQSRGGADTWENLVVACVPCNVRKGNQTPEEAGMRLLRKPMRPAWMPHFGTRVPAEKLSVWRRFVDTTHWQAPAPLRPLHAVQSANEL